MVSTFGLDHVHKEEGRYTVKGANARIWIEALQADLGDHCPDSPDIYLPPQTKSDYFAEYVAEVKETVKLKHFSLFGEKSFQI